MSVLGELHGFTTFFRLDTPALFFCAICLVLLCIQYSDSPKYTLKSLRGLLYLVWVVWVGSLEHFCRFLCLRRRLAWKSSNLVSEDVHTQKHMRTHLKLLSLRYIDVVQPDSFCHTGVEGSTGSMVRSRRPRKRRGRFLFVSANVSWLRQLVGHESESKPKIS